MRIRDMKREVRAVFADLDIDAMAALHETTDAEYCRRRLSEAMIMGEPLAKVLPFAILSVIHAKVKS